MAEKKDVLDGVDLNVFENDFGEGANAADLELNDDDFACFAERKTAPVDLRDAGERKAYETYLKKHGIKL